MKKTCYILLRLCLTVDHGGTASGAETKAVLYRTYLCEFWELSVQIYASIDLIYDNIHLSSAVVPSDPPQVAYQKSTLFFKRMSGSRNQVQKSTVVRQQNLMHHTGLD